MVTSLFKQQKGHINYFFENIDHEATEKIIDKLHNCSGSIIFSGVGKSGIIAKKLAVTFSSTGVKSFYLSPLNALHGDLGMVGSEDIFILLSKSGQTKELLNLIPHIRQKKAFIIGLASQKKSLFHKECDLSIYLPMVKELCPFNLAPTTSAAVQLIFGDILAVALMEKNKITLQEYSLNHPSGTIGKKTTLIVDKIMRKNDDIPICKPNDLIAEVIPTLSNKRCGAIIVTDDKKNLLGIFTDGDLRRAIQNNPKDLFYQKVSNFMTKSPKSIIRDMLAWDALKLMEKNPKQLVMVLPVVEGSKVVGILHMHDILQAGLTV